MKLVESDAQKQQEAMQQIVEASELLWSAKREQPTRTNERSRLLCLSADEMMHHNFMKFNYRPIPRSFHLRAG